MSMLKDFQYKDSSKYNARIHLHHKFGTNKYLLPRWIFDNITMKNDLKVLELGCGNGLLWRLNANRIPDTWEIILSDFSEGMLKDVRNNIGDSIKNIAYEVIDAEHIPHEDHSFDIIIANNMLYHVPDRDKAISEIHRVLKNEGVLYATTLSQDYMKEIKELIYEFKGKSPNEGTAPVLIKNFSIENGKEQLSREFNTISMKIYENQLIINEAEPLVDFIYSLNGINQERIIVVENERESLLHFIKNKIEHGNTIVIPASNGLFICSNTM